VAEVTLEEAEALEAATVAVILAAEVQGHVSELKIEN
jgi:hypothetical protein